MNPGPGPRRLPGRSWIIAVLSGIAPLGCSARSAGVDQVTAETVARGREVAARACGGCHLEPAPDLLGPAEWSYALSYMGFFLGQELGDGPTAFHRRHREPAVVGNLRGKLALLRALDRAPTAPAMPEADWEALRAYFLDGARRGRTGGAPPADPETSIAFARQEVRTTRPGSVVPALAVDAVRGELLFGQIGGASGAPGLLGVVAGGPAGSRRW